MKRHGNLWPQLVSFRNLLRAYEQAARGKRRRLLPRSNVVRMRQRVRRLRDGLGRGVLTWSDVRKSLAGWLGHACHADTRHLQQRLLEGILAAEG